MANTLQLLSREGSEITGKYEKRVKYWPMSHEATMR